MGLHCLWKLCATPGANIKPGCLARRPLCRKVDLPICVARRPLCHKVNLSSCVAKPTEMWSSAALFHHDLWYFRHRRNEHFSPMLFNRKTYKPNYWKSYWREPHTHSTKGFDDSLETCEIERCRVSEPVFKHNSLCPAFTTKNVVLGKLKRLASNDFYFVLNFSNWLNVEFPKNRIND